MKILNLVVVLGIVFGWNISANAAEDDFGLDDVLFEGEENLSSDTNKITEETQQKIDTEKAKLDEVINDIDSDIPAEKEQSYQEAEENVVIKEASLSENKADDEKAAEKEITEEQPTVKEESVSDYIKKLDLSDEQLDTAKFISSEMEMRQEQLQK